MSKKPVIIENIRLMKLVHGGQCLAESENGKKIFVWGGLPGELVDVTVTKKKSSYLEAIVVHVHEKSNDRIEPKEPLSYLSTSPWQIMAFDAENNAKQTILSEAFEREGILDIRWADFYANQKQFNYRNKNEFGFWGDDNGLHLAHYVRGTSGKQMVTESTLATEYINQAARDVRDELSRLGIWGGKLKTVLIRSSEAGDAVAALFMKEELDMSNFKLPVSLKGIDIYYSNPLSPASVATKKLYAYGDTTLVDTIDAVPIKYDVLSFFQVNIAVFEEALQDIKKSTTKKTANRVVDLYSGVGTIGLCVGADVLIESDEPNIVMAKINAKQGDVKVVHATAETALDYIETGDVLIVDPPRAGLHKDVVNRLLEARPLAVVYLSCNPSTQARDVKLLQEKYNITYARGFNFFPRTPHIESLVVLESL